MNATTPRTNFNLTTFGQSVGLGSPVAGTFFLTGPSDSTNTTSVNGTATLQTPAPAPSTTDTTTMGTSGANEVGSNIIGTMAMIIFVYVMSILL